MRKFKIFGTTMYLLTEVELDELSQRPKPKCANDTGSTRDFFKHLREGSEILSVVSPGIVEEIIEASKKGYMMYR